jgi:hypothetical protein
MESARPLNHLLADSEVRAPMKSKICSRSRTARGMILTRYAILCAHLVEELGSGPTLATAQLL